MHRAMATKGSFRNNRKVSSEANRLTLSPKPNRNEAETEKRNEDHQQALETQKLRLYFMKSTPQSQAQNGGINVTSAPSNGPLPKLQLSLKKEPGKAQSVGRGSPPTENLQPWGSFSAKLQRTKSHSQVGVLGESSTSTSPLDKKSTTFQVQKPYAVPFEIPVFNAANKRLDSLGRTLSRILRHEAVRYNIHIRPDGYCKVEDVLRLRVRTHAGFPLNSHTVEDIVKVVAEDPKRRFSMLCEHGHLYMRANQGHSMKAVLSHELLSEISDAQQVSVCVHGTLKVNIPSIVATGLSRMGRNHIHFATGLPNEEGVVSGMREACDALIYLDVRKALREGMKLYMSENKVLLTEGFGGIVPPAYFEKIVEWPSLKAIAFVRTGLD